MLTIALHKDESVFAYLSAVQKGIRKIRKTGLYYPDFSFDRPFFAEQSSKTLFSKMFKEILNDLSLKEQDIHFSFPADVAYINVYDDVKQENVRTIANKDIWLTEQKFGKEMISASDCQVKVVYKNNGLARLIPIYFPKNILDIVNFACAENDCNLVGLGINILNASEIAEKLTEDLEFFVLSYEARQYELIGIEEGSLQSYARFSALNDKAFYYSKRGKVFEDLCEAVIKKDSKILNKYRIFMTGTSGSLEHIQELIQCAPDIVVLNPMSINSAYSKPILEYDRKYNTVFSSALGALI